MLQLAWLTNKQCLRSKVVVNVCVLVEGEAWYEHMPWMVVSLEGA